MVMKLLEQAKRSRMQLWRTGSGPWGAFTLNTPWFSFAISLMPGNPAMPPKSELGTTLGTGIYGGGRGTTW
jgi:hypothetical protein